LSSPNYVAKAFSQDPDNDPYRKIRDLYFGVHKHKTS